MKSTILLGAMASMASAHTWVEQLMVIAPNGTMVGQPGFPRGNVLRGTPGFGDPAMVNLIPSNDRPINQIFDTDLMCKSTQTTQTQTGGSPRLQAAAGANVALRYQENGHVSLPQNQPGKPENRGTLFVYGTTQPRADDKFLSIHRVWTADGSGGDGRGVLLSTQNYDDGQCYQVNGGTISTQRQVTFKHTTNSLMGADLWCQQDIQIPVTAPSGKPYTLYWVWDWPTLPGTEGFPDGKQELYTTCMDVDVVASGNAQQKVAAVNFVKQDFVSAAIATQLANVANPTAVKGQFIPFANQASGGAATATGGSGSTAPANTPAASSTTAPTAAANTPAASSSTTSAPAGQTPPNGNGDGSRTHTRTHSRPSVAPIGQTSAPFSQASPAASPSESNNGSSGQNRGPANTVAPSSSNNGNRNGNDNSNTGTAISNAAVAAPTTVTVPGVGKIVTQVQTVISTIMQTTFETVYASATAPAKQQRSVEAADASAPYSRTEAAYLLRARAPWKAVPVVDNDHGKS